MILSLLCLVAALAPQAQAPTPSLPFVVSILNETEGDDVVDIDAEQDGVDGHGG